MRFWSGSRRRVQIAAHAVEGHLSSCCSISYGNPLFLWFIPFGERMGNKMQEGWVCPKCGNVYAPFVSKCVRCNCPTNAPTSTPLQTGEPIPREPYKITCEGGVVKMAKCGDARMISPFCPCPKPTTRAQFIQELRARFENDDNHED